MKYKINVQNSVVFIYSNNQLEDLIGEKSSYITATEKIKYINLMSRKMWDLLKIKFKIILMATK